MSQFVKRVSSKLGVSALSLANKTSTASLKMKAPYTTLSVRAPNPLAKIASRTYTTNNGHKEFWQDLVRADDKMIPLPNATKAQPFIINQVFSNLITIFNKSKNPTQQLKELKDAAVSGIKVIAITSPDGTEASDITRSLKMKEFLDNIIPKDAFAQKLQNYSFVELSTQIFNVIDNSVKYDKNTGSISLISPLDKEKHPGFLKH